MIQPMKTDLKSIFVLILVIFSVRNLELLINETIRYESFDSLDLKAIKWKSQEGNIFYDIVQEKDGKLKLFYYRMEDRLQMIQPIHSASGDYIRSGGSSCAESFVGQSCSRCSPGYFFLYDGNGLTGKCMKCDEECQTCMGTASTCLTCGGESKRLGFRCVGRIRVVLRLILMTPLTNVARIMEKVIDWILENFNINLPQQMTPLKKRQVILRSAKWDSSFLEFVISVQTVEVSKLIVNGLTKKIMEGPIIDGAMLTGFVSTETQSVIKNCNEMLNDTSCKTCQAGFTLHHHKCTKTVPNCRVYDKMGNCIKCSEMFVLFKNKCQTKATLQNCKQLKTLKKLCFKVNGRCLFTNGYDYSRC